jgi:hypothetical protein
MYSVCTLPNCLLFQEVSDGVPSQHLGDVTLGEQIIDPHIVILRNM